MEGVNEQALLCPLPFTDIDQCTGPITSCFRRLFTRAAFPLSPPRHDNMHGNDYLRGRQLVTGS
jgi:hypothetical protein